MNSTAIGIKEFSTQMVTDLYCKIDESAAVVAIPRIMIYGIRSLKH